MVAILSKNSIITIHNDPNFSTNATLQQPILQILNVKKVPNQERYRLLVSDGVHYMNAMAAATLNALFETAAGGIEKESIVRLKQFSLSEVNARKILIIFDMELVEQPKHGKIGDPQNIATALTSGGGATGVISNAGQKPSGSIPSLPVTQSNLPQRAQATSAPVAQNSTTNSDGDSTCLPIKVLNPYNNSWTIKARVSNKSEMRTWANPKSEGRLFSCTLIDGSAEIKATAFNEQADKFFPIIDDNKVYMISNGQVKIARKQFNTVQNDYEITFDRNTSIAPCADNGAVPSIRYNLVPLQNLVNYQKDSTVDVIGIVNEIGALDQITAKATQRQMTKRDITLIDQSSTAVRLTLWGKQAETFEGDGNPVIIVKTCRVNDYNGISLSASSGSTIMLNPDVAEAYPLRGWFDQFGAQASSTVTNLSAQGAKKAGGATGDRKYLSSIQNEELGQHEKPDYMTVRAMVTTIRSDKNLWYTACPGENCSKKVTQEGSEYRCEKCARTYSYCEYRYIMGMNVADATGSAWLNCFNEIAEQILGHSAAELNQYKETGNDDAFNAVFYDSSYKSYIFKLRIKQEFYNDEMRVKSTIMTAEPVNYAEESKYLADLIEQYF